MNNTFIGQIKYIYGIIIKKLTWNESKSWVSYISLYIDVKLYKVIINYVLLGVDIIKESHEIIIKHIIRYLIILYYFSFFIYLINHQKYFYKVILFVLIILMYRIIFIQKIIIFVITILLKYAVKIFPMSKLL